MSASFRAAIKAISDGDHSGLQRILSKTPKFVEQYGPELMLHAAETNNVGVMPTLLATGVDVNAPVLDQTPLTAAVTEGSLGAVAWLLDHGADVDRRASERDATPLHAAITSDNLELVKLLLKHGADPELMDGNPARNSLAAARFWGNDDIARYLVRQGQKERTVEPKPVNVESPAFRKRDLADPQEWFEKKWWHVYDYGSRRGLPAMRKKNRVFFLVGYLIDQVCGGGIESFYENPSADYALQLPEALDAIGAKRTATLVRNINALFPNGKPAANMKIRVRQMGRKAKEMSSLGKQLERSVAQQRPRSGGNALLSQLYAYYHD